MIPTRPLKGTSNEGKVASRANTESIVVRSVNLIIFVVSLPDFSAFKQVIVPALAKTAVMQETDRSKIAWTKGCIPKKLYGLYTWNLSEKDRTNTSAVRELAPTKLVKINPASEGFVRSSVFLSTTKRIFSTLSSLPYARLIKLSLSRESSRDSVSFFPSRSPSPIPRKLRRCISSSYLLSNKQTLFNPIAPYWRYAYIPDIQTLLHPIGIYEEMQNKNNENGNLDNFLNKETRMDRGLSLFQKAKKVISENSDGSFSVPSQSVEEIAYTVRLIGKEYSCNCPDFVQRHEEIGICKHIHAVKFWIASQTYLKQEAPKPRVFADDSIQCDKCGSIRVIKYGITAHKQTYWCKDCSHKFTPSLIKKSKFTPELVSLTLDLYFSGTSLRKISRIISDHTGQYLGATTVYDWIQKFVPKIAEYTNSLSPELSDTWHADELFVKMRNGVDYRKNKSIAFLWNIMDRKTRFLLASKLSPLRDRIGARDAFVEARNNAHGNYPEKVLTDAFPSYDRIAYARATGWNIKHIAKMGVNKPHANNNRIERCNGTLRERTKVQRGWKSFGSALAEGQRVHYNFVKPHMALEKQTPAQRAGIPIKNSWNELLRLALTNQTRTSEENNQ